MNKSTEHYYVSIPRKHIFEARQMDKIVNQDDVLKVTGMIRNINIICHAVKYHTSLKTTKIC